MFMCTRVKLNEDLISSFYIMRFFDICQVNFVLISFNSFHCDVFPRHT